MSNNKHLCIGLCLTVVGWAIVGGVAGWNGYFDYYAFTTGVFMASCGLYYVAAMLGSQP